MEATTNPLMNEFHTFSFFLPACPGQECDGPGKAESSKLSLVVDVIPVPDVVTKLSVFSSGIFSMPFSPGFLFISHVFKQNQTFQDTSSFLPYS